MSTSRPTVPPSVRRSVLKEFNHRCAICGGDNPQIHHIDENPANNDPQNLLPLCPNHHLTDQHSPTRKHDQGILRLFRKFKDPAILKPQFQPLYIRFKFIETLATDSNVDSGSIVSRARDLTNFIKPMEMGSYYSEVIDNLLMPPPMHLHITVTDPEMIRQQNIQFLRERTGPHKTKILEARDRIIGLLIELLRFQNWPDTK